MQMSGPPPAYSTSSLSRGYHSMSPPTAADRQLSTPPTVTTPAVKSQTRRSLPAVTMTSVLSWETFNDTDEPFQSNSTVTAKSSQDMTRQSPLTTAVAAGTSDAAIQKRSESATQSVTANDVSKHCVLHKAMVT